MLLARLLLRECSSAPLTTLATLTTQSIGTYVRVRGRLTQIRNLGSVLFLIIRDEGHTIQAVCPHAKINHTDITKESIVEVTGLLTSPKSRIHNCTKQIEIQLTNIELKSKSHSKLPYQIENTNNDKVKLDTRLDNRSFDLRSAFNHSIFKTYSDICSIIRRTLHEHHFIEIFTPKIAESASEGGSKVFPIDYYGKKAFLTQSPQLYKQMAICGDMKRVFEIGPSFRAENSNTGSHLSQFTMLDVEMEIADNYIECIDYADSLISNIFKELHPSPTIKYQRVVISYDDACTMLRENKCNQSPETDFTKQNEKKLSQIIKKKFDSDCFFVTGFPKCVRPFYTLADGDRSYSFDAYMSSEEILSGSERITDYAMLKERAISSGMDVGSINDYLESFRYGVPRHGGFGMGIERLVKCICGCKDIRSCCMFPRDPQRLRP